MIYVVGSGPSGVAAATGLLARGLEVTLLDTGRTLEKDKAALLQSLQSLPRDQWPETTVNVLKGRMDSSRHGVPNKLIYGSGFAYRNLEEVDDFPSNMILKVSSAQGGLSNVWGAALLPFHSADIQDWPFPASDLIPHYQAVFDLLPYSACKDSLVSLLPLYSEKFSCLQPSRQAQQLLNHLSLGRARLNDQGVWFGRSRLAVRAETVNQKPGCVYCGLCLTGCPYKLIYTATETLEFLKRNPLFHYELGVRVTTVQEHERSVQVEGTREEGDERVVFRGDRVFLACGAYSTTQILLRSSQALNEDIFLKTCQYFILPFITYSGVRGIREEALHTLCQLFLIVADPAVSPHLVHLQGYTYCELFSQTVLNYLGPFGNWFRGHLDWLLGRLVVFQGFLHSNHSPQIRMRLTPGGPGSHVQLMPIFKPETKQVLNRLGRKLGGLRKSLGGWPINSLLSVGKVGDGSHIGGSFPMRYQPGKFESDRWGRPFGFKRVHAVDSSVLPSIPSTTLTLSVMANAHRIATEFQDD